MRNKRKFISMLVLVAVVLTGCLPGVAQTYSNEELTGQVTEMNAEEVTMLLGELLEGGEPGDFTGAEFDNTTGGMPNGSGNGMQKDPQGQEPPAKPDGVDENSLEQVPSKDQQNLDARPMPGEAGMQIFQAGEESYSFTLTNAAAIAVEDSEGTLDGTLEDIQVDSIIRVQFGEDNTVASVTVLKNVMTGMDQNPPGGQPGGFGGSMEVTNGTSVNTISEDGSYVDATYTSTGDDENALRIDGATVELSDVAIDKAGGLTSNTENGDFYGQNAGLLALNGANVTIKGATVTTGAQNGNGVFSYGTDTIVTISDSIIATSADNSGGIQTTGGGTTYANNLTIATSGNSSAAIRSDRGGGTVVVDGGSYATAGTGSPAIYSTADITVKNATLTATSSEAIVVEGKNSVLLEDCTVSGAMTGTYADDDAENKQNVMLYQSMSGDADVGTSSFKMTGGSLTAKEGDMFYATNTNSIISLSGVEMALANGTLLTVEGNQSSRGWGTAGKNGGNVDFSAEDQLLEGVITVDAISTLHFALADGSTFTGTLNIVENGAGGEAVADNAVVSIAEGCTWTLTGDCSITSMDNAGTVDYNGYTITLANGTILDGTND